MTAGTDTIQALAEQASAYFETATRPDGDTFARLRDGAPEWLQDAIRAAHGDMLPDDVVYGYCREAVDFIAENGEGEDSAREFADNVDVYSPALAEWYSSHSARRSFVEEARDEGLIDATDNIDRQLMAGQYLERQQVYGAMLEALREQVAA